MSLDDPQVLSVELGPHIDWAEHFLATGVAGKMPGLEVVTVAVTLMVAASKIAERVQRVEAQAFSGTWVAAMVNLAIASVRCHPVHGAFDDVLFLCTHVLRDRNDGGRHGAELLIALRALVTT